MSITSNFFQRLWGRAEVATTAETLPLEEDLMDEINRLSRELSLLDQEKNKEQVKGPNEFKQGLKGLRQDIGRVHTSIKAFLTPYEQDDQEEIKRLLAFWIAGFYYRQLIQLEEKIIKFCDGIRHHYRTEQDKKRVKDPPTLDRENYIKECESIIRDIAQICTCSERAEEIWNEESERCGNNILEIYSAHLKTSPLTYSSNRSDLFYDVWMYENHRKEIEACRAKITSGGKMTVRWLYDELDKEYFTPLLEQAHKKLGLRHRNSGPAR